jgi:hypothetical protein
VEGLHASFEKIGNKVRTLIQKGSTDSDLACCIRESWSEQFHMGLSAPATKGMIMHYRAIFGKSDKSGKTGKSGSGRKTRKSQKGGMAPMDWTMGQGTTDHVYGRFPVEMGTSGQIINALGNTRFTENRVGRSCDTTGGHGAKIGGGLQDAIFAGHFPASVPRNPVEMLGSALQGAPIRNQPEGPVTDRVPLMTYTPRAYDAGTISNLSSLSNVYAGY